MAKRNQRTHPVGRKAPDGASWSRLLLALTLVPLVIGGLLILAWGLDMVIWDPPETQVWVGILFILFSFAASNSIQRKWYPAIGWGLLAIADFMLFRWIILPIQILAGIFVVIGVGLIIYEVYRTRQTQHQGSKISKS
jgi:lipoprotein signal peptidase